MLTYSMSVPPRDTAVAHKRTRSFCQKCKWQVTPKDGYTFDPTKSGWADYGLSTHSVGIYQETSSHANRQGTLGQSSQLAEPLWADPGVKSGISVRELIST